ncbi:unnamed protein product [Brassica oleracea]
MAASALALPFQPLMVSAVHIGMMEVSFAKRVLKDPDLKAAHNVHKMSTLLGGVLFIANNLFPETTIHSRWLASRCSHWRWNLQ